MNRIEQYFRRTDQKCLSVYFTAGFPDLHDTVPIIRYLDDAGVDMIEIGFPFSDPLADGPVIRQSHVQAIKNGMCLKVLFEQLKDIRNLTQKPLLLMGYLNPVLQMGEREFISTCSEVGIDGVIIPDMPPEYFEKNLQNIFLEKKIANILLITPETPRERIHYIDSLTKGFLYVVSSNSITGSDKPLHAQKDYFMKIRNLNLKNPTLVGFGIKNKESYDFACAYTHGAIIGTGFIEHLKKDRISDKSIQAFVKKIRP